MEQIPSWENNSCSAGQKIIVLCGTQRFSTKFTKACQWSPS